VRACLCVYVCVSLIVGTVPAKFLWCVRVNVYVCVCVCVCVIVDLSHGPRDVVMLRKYVCV